MIKRHIVKLVVLGLGSLSINAVSAQEMDMNEAPIENRAPKHNKSERRAKIKAFRKSLSEDQLAQFKQLKEDRIARRKSFRATFTEEQKAILDDKSLSRKEVKKALKATFSESQKQQHEANKLANKEAMDTFRATLSEEQKELMPKKKPLHFVKGQRKRRG